MTESIQTSLGAREGKSALDRAQTLLEAGKPEEATSLLEGVAEPSVRLHALRGAAFFRREEYERAAKEWHDALAIDPSDRDLLGLHERALANFQADVKRRVPEPMAFDRTSLLSGPKPGDHPRIVPEPQPKASFSELLVKALGDAAGLKLGHALQSLTQLLGDEPESDRKWTSWYEHDLLRATIMLAKRRERLNRKQIFPAYSAKDGTGFYRHDGNPIPGWVHVARTADGSFNDLRDPMAGAAFTRFGFNTDPTQTVAETGKRMLTPNPRQVSRALLTRKAFQPAPFLNVLTGAWIQFMNHDWISYGDPAEAEPIRVPLSDDDPMRRLLHQTHMLVKPTQKDPTLGHGEVGHINEVTSWWDGSQIYGSDAATVESLRSHVQGKLTIDPATGRLPVATDGVEQTGFRRNWWVGLSLLHTLFTREHNAISDMLAARYPEWDDQRLFDTARLINAAVMAKIHTVEWTPAVLPNEALNTAMMSNWYGFLTNALRSKRDRKTLAEINVADPVGGGLVGNATDNHEVPYSLTREFVAVYRLHSFLPDELELHAIGQNGTPLGRLGLAEMRQANAPRITEKYGLADLFYSFGRQNAGALVLNNFPATLQNLSIPGAGFYDLGAVDVLRDRERGVPRYNQFRRLLGLRPLERFDELTEDVEALKALKSVYETIEDVDLLIGNLAETYRPTGFGFGETLFEIFILNASRRLQADRFFTESFREDVYTPEGLAWIDEVTMKRVLLRHYPSLVGTGLSNIENAFEPWDTGELDPARHPLRQFDPALREADERARRRNGA